MNWTSSKLKKYICPSKDTQKVKRQFTKQEKILQIIYLIRDLYPGCINNYNSMLLLFDNIIKKQITQIKMGKGFEQEFLQRKY